MRYLGNKESLVGYIDDILRRHNISGASIFDFFAGTTNVGRYYKERGYQVFSSDILYLSYCLQKAYIENNAAPRFERLAGVAGVCAGSLFSTPLERVIAYLNEIDDVEGFIYNNYTPGGTQKLEQPRMYFSDENGRRIDAIRTRIEQWRKTELLTDSEYYILLACLIESVSFYANVAGVYAAFSKKWDPRAVKRFMLRPINLIEGTKENFVYNANSLDLVRTVEADIIYVDPPYNERQYLPNYHVVETIARYDAPNIKGVTGMREYSKEKSSFCSRKTALRDLGYIAANTPCHTLVLSYNSEGIMPTDAIIETLSAYGEVMVHEIERLRFKSNNNGLSRTRKHIQERVFILKK